MTTFLGIIAIIAIFYSLILITAYKQKIKEWQSKAEGLQKSLDEMDDQAKLIVRTDMELNKTQEALDKKITGLYALQRLSRAISTTLDEAQIFKRIEANSLEDLGFEKALAFLFNAEENKFLPYMSIGYMDDELEGIKSFIDSNRTFYLNLIRGGETFSSLSVSSASKAKEGISQIMKVKSFVISCILPKQGNKGFLFAGTQNPDILITEGDEELTTILTNQLGQALENARLFEETWQAQQELEKRVKERTQQLSAALDEVQKISRRKTEFVSNVSHELRTPLTSIKGYASILTSGQLGQLPPEAQSRIEKINERSNELVQFINDLLDLSRIESGRVTMKPEPQDLNKIIEELSDLLSVMLKEKQIEFKANIPAEAAKVLADYGLIKRVFINLVNNAIKYTPEKGKISIAAHQLNKEVQIDIVDTGCGISEEAQHKLFQEFYRADSEINQQVKGSGLGLALVKNIVEAHKGKIWVKSKAGSGSTFSFTIPQAG